MPIIMRDFITGGFTANTGLSKWCRRTACCCTSTAMHAVIDRHPSTASTSAFSPVSASVRW